MATPQQFPGAVGQLPQPFLWEVQLTMPEGVPGLDGNLGNKPAFLAQEVTIPNESSTFAEFGQENRGGFLPGYGLMQRESFLTRTVSINFLETVGTDIEHNYLRPWMIAIGRDGLVNGIYRGSITVNQQSNDGGQHKGYQFSHVFPTNCEGFTVNYGSQDFLAKTVTFSCRDYRLI